MNSALDIWSQGLVTHNLILLQGLGLFALTRYTSTIGNALHAGVTMIATMVTASLLAWLVQALIPSFYGLDVPVLVFVALLAAMFWNRMFTQIGWNVELGVSKYFNSALVGVLLLMTKNNVVGVDLVTFGFSASIGYGLVLVIMAGIRERLDYAPIPKALQGTPILLISAGLLALALLGYRF